MASVAHSGRDRDDPSDGMWERDWDPWRDEDPWSGQDTLGGGDRNRIGDQSSELIWRFWPWYAICAVFGVVVGIPASVIGPNPPTAVVFVAVWTVLSATLAYVGQGKMRGRSVWKRRPPLPGWGRITSLMWRSWPFFAANFVMAIVLLIMSRSNATAVSFLAVYAVVALICAGLGWARTRG